MPHHLRRSLAACCLIGSAAAAENTVEYVRLDAVPAPAMGYGYWLPAGFSATTATYPVMVHLGGTGERGDGKTQLGLVLNNGPLNLLKNPNAQNQAFREFFAKHPFIVVQPQLLSADGGWAYPSPASGKLHTLINQDLDAKFPGRIDHQRVWLSGFSLGGGGVWLYSQLYASEIAASMPIEGAASSGSSQSLERFIGLPVWAFQNFNDQPYRDFTGSWLKNIVARWQGAAPTDPYANFPSTAGDHSAGYRMASGYVWSDGLVAPGADVPAMTMFAGGGHNWTQAMLPTASWQWLVTQNLANRPFRAGLVVDNFDPARTSKTGNWQLEAPPLNSPASQLAFLDNGHLGSSGAQFTFSPVIPASGTYQVQLRWTTPATNPAATRNSAVPVDITSPTGTATVTVNQQQNGATWVTLGQYRFAAGGACAITLRTAGLTSAVSADAVRLLPVDVLAVDGLSPIDGPAAGGTVVTLIGSGFGAGTAVSFGSAPATVTAVTATTITCAAPALPAGRCPITVTRDGAAYTRFGAYTAIGTGAHSRLIQMSPLPGPRWWEADPPFTAMAPNLATQTQSITGWSNQTAVITVAPASAIQ
ncbi:hypothetical protein LBMAG53_00620 [Planctomycetota bacterium]|nr:hypothetical protein LBMAG53_00620 [Planctomycetota bacterium]